MPNNINQKDSSRTGFGVLMFGLGTVFGLIIAVSCGMLIGLISIIPFNSQSQPLVEPTTKPDAYVELTLGEDACHVVRSEVQGTTPVSSLTWVFKDFDDYVLLKRNAKGSYNTKFMRGGQYKVSFEAFYNGQYHTISNEIIIDCPQLP